MVHPLLWLVGERTPCAAPHQNMPWDHRPRLAIAFFAGALHACASVALAQTTTPLAISDPAQAPAAGGIASQSPADRELPISSSLADGEWRRPTDPIEIALAGELAAADRRFAVIIGDTDWTGVFARGPRQLSFRPGALRLPSGETTLTVYSVSAAGEWEQIAAWPLKVLTPAGLIRADIVPKVDLANKGQIAEGHTPDSNAPPRDTFQDLVANLGLRTAHTFRSGVTTTLQVNMLGATFGPETLRFATKADEAPHVDLADYVVGIEGRHARLQVGHVGLDPHRYLASGFKTRGVSGLVRLGAMDFSAAAVNGTEIVGWSNPFGVADRHHRVVLASVGADLVRRHPGAARVEATFLDGSLLPTAGFTDARVTDAETSTGVGVRVLLKDPAQRVRIDAGASRSRFTNPSDPLLEQGLSVLPVRERSGLARYVDASVDLLRRSVGASSPFVLTGTYRHERVDPLYRSVAATQNVRSDLMLHTFEVSSTLGPAIGQVAYTRSHDNLGQLDSILTTLTRVVAANAAVPLGGWFKDPGRGRWFPLVSYTLARTHQFGDGLPVNGGFDSLSQVPDQISTNHVVRIDWTGAQWRAGYALNDSFQDNRQVGRVQADLGNASHVLSFGLTPRPQIDFGVDVALENAENLELARTTRTRRGGLTANWRPTRSSTLTGLVNRTTTLEAAVSDTRITETMLQFSQAIPLPGPAARRPRAQLFVRYSWQSGDLFDLLFGIPEARRNWSLNTGVTLNVFQGAVQ